MSATFSSSNLRRSQFIRNPDENFVLHGRPASYWEKPNYLSNTQLTNTSSRLSQHSEFNPEKYKDKQYVRSLGDLASNLKGLSSRFHDTLGSSDISFKTKRPQTASAYFDRTRTQDSLYEDSYSKLMNGLESDMSLSGRPLSPEESEWFRRSSSYLHRDSSRRGKYREGIVKMTTISQEGEEQETSEEEPALEQHDCYPLTTHDSLVKQFFPVTYSFPEELLKSDKCMNSKLSQSKQSNRLKSAAHLSLRSDVDQMLLLHSEAPLTATAPPTIMSPYQTDLGSLRMERLRLEEDRLLELKRLAELERIRGPKPKWYESCGPEFHYEAHKNTEMIKHDKHWNDLVTYRDKLLRSSSDFHKSYELEA